LWEDTSINNATGADTMTTTTNNTDAKVTVYFAVLQPQPTRKINGKLIRGHMGGYLNASGDVSIRGNRCSTNRSEIEARAALACAKHPTWVVDIRSTLAPAAMFN
jgi:hypothetical protein